MGSYGPWVFAKGLCGILSGLARSTEHTSNESPSSILDSAVRRRRVPDPGVLPFWKRPKGKSGF